MYKKFKIKKTLANIQKQNSPFVARMVERLSKQSSIFRAISSQAKVGSNIQKENIFITHDGDVVLHLTCDNGDNIIYVLCKNGQESAMYKRDPQLKVVKDGTCCFKTQKNCGFDSVIENKFNNKCEHC